MRESETSWKTNAKTAKADSTRSSNDPEGLLCYGFASKLKLCLLDVLSLNLNLDSML